MHEQSGNKALDLHTGPDLMHTRRTEVTPPCRSGCNGPLGNARRFPLRLTPVVRWFETVPSRKLGSRLVCRAAVRGSGSG
jgi:hypothetical protein